MADKKEEQAIFLESVSSLKEYAKVNGGIITKEDVLSYFNGMQLDDAKLQMIYGYLMANNIKIRGAETVDNQFLEMMEGTMSGTDQVQDTTNNENVTEPDNSDSSGSTLEANQTVYEDTLDYKEDEKFVSLYLDDLKKIEKMSDTTRACLLVNIVEDNDPQSLKLLSESFLEKVIEWVEPFYKKGVFASDLIQEGNLAMMAYISQKEWLHHLEWKDKIKEGTTQDLLAVLKQMESEVKEEVIEAINRLLEEQNSSSQVSNKVLNKVNLVNDWAVRLKQDLNRKPTLDEVAEHMGISKEMVMEAIQFSAEAIEDIDMGNSTTENI